MLFKESFFVVLTERKYAEKKLKIQYPNGFFFHFFVHIFALLGNSPGNTPSPIFWPHLLKNKNTNFNYEQNCGIGLEQLFGFYRR